MKNFFRLFAICFFTALFFITTTVHSQEKPKTPPIRQQETIPVSKLRMLPDIALENLSAELQNTQLGQPGIEFPTDNVKIEMTIKNVGQKSFPTTEQISLIIRRNDQEIHNTILTLSKESVDYTFIDVFPHSVGKIYNYKVTISSNIGEASKVNNEATFETDETKLHPGGSIDFSIQIFNIEKKWQQVGDNFTCSFNMSADVTNSGSGYSPSGSKITFTKDGSELTSFLINSSDLPGPGENLRFEKNVDGSLLPLGEYNVYAKIDPITSEINLSNNESLNAGKIINFANPLPGEILVVNFEELQKKGNNKLAISMIFTNKEDQPINDLRLLLLKNDYVIKEWSNLTLQSRSSLKRKYDDIILQSSDNYNYRIILTADKSSMPYAGSILAADTTSISTMEFAEDLVNSMIKDELIKKINEYDKNCHVKEVYTNITTSAINLTLKGKQVINNKPDCNFTMKVPFYPSVVKGRFTGKVGDLDIDCDLSNEWLWDMLSLGIVEAVKVNIVNKYEEIIKEKLSPSQLSSLLPGGFNLCGVYLFDGSMVLALFGK